MSATETIYTDAFRFVQGVTDVAMPREIYRVAVDFDGTIADRDPATGSLVFRPGAREFLAAAHLSGVHVVIHSCRCTWVPLEPSFENPDDFYRFGIVSHGALQSWALFDEMRAFLLAAGVWSCLEIWQSPGKPFADRYVDDRGAPPDFIALAGELGVVLANDPRGASTVGAATSIGPGALPGVR